MKRLFFALWPNDIVRQKCVAVISSISQESIRPIANNNIHVTLVFLGNIDSNQEALLIDGADEIVIPEIIINFNRLSYWKKSGILCLTASKPCSELQTVVADLSSLATDLNIKLDERPYKLHVTLARNTQLLTRADFEPVQWLSNSFCLVQSHTLPSRLGEYEIIKEWKAN